MYADRKEKNGRPRKAIVNEPISGYRRERKVQSSLGKQA
jgi:hypothetical protein